MEGKNVEMICVEEFRIGEEMPRLVRLVGAKYALICTMEAIHLKRTANNFSLAKYKASRVLHRGAIQQCHSELPRSIKYAYALNVESFIILFLLTFLERFI